MTDIFSILSMFILLIICTFVFYFSKHVKIPYTVLLVTFGLIIGFATQLESLKPFIGFLNNFTLTPNLLFFIFLPTLIFESAFNINIRNMIENFWSITVLSVIGLLISTFVIATALFYLFPLIGLNVPYILLLLFASIISATDPVAVLALFKEYGAPKRLTLIFEGESLFNDGTAVALFLVLLAVVDKGFMGTQTILVGIGTFISMIFLGAVFGLAIAAVFTKAIAYTRDNEFISITLLIVSAHIIFIISELINQHGFFGLHLHVSPIIATTFGALFLGNYARHILSPKGDEYMDKSIGHLVFVINSLVFILIGILFASTKIDITKLFIPILITIFVVAFARAISVYASVIPLNKMKLEDEIPTSWQHLLSWGSLRGALAIIVVLLIPDSISISGWALPYSPKEFLIALTSGCILATLFIKATTIKSLMNKWSIYDHSIFEQISKLNSSLIFLLNQKSKLSEFRERGFLFNQVENKNLEKKINTDIEKVEDEINSLKKINGEKVFEQEALLSSINLEESYLKDLYIYNEINEKVYRRLRGKLNLQRERVLSFDSENINHSIFSDKKDVFDRLVNFVLSPYSKKNLNLSKIEKVEYYRAQTILSRKVLKNLEDVFKLFNHKIYSENVYNSLNKRYSKYFSESNEKLSTLIETDLDKLKEHLETINKKSLERAGQKGVEFFVERGLITSNNPSH